MLNVPNLDDQRFDEVVAAAIEKIPHLYPEWTDFNAHDPGITMLELFAWYKQMQQYHLNCIPERNLEAFFKLLGIRRAAARPYACVLRLETPAWLPEGTPLISEAGVEFALSGGMEAGGLAVKAIYSERADGIYDVSNLFGRAETACAVFGEALRGDPHALYIGLAAEEAPAIVQLWLNVAETRHTPRNPFAPDSADPRTIVYEAIAPTGARPLEIVLDETHALSLSGRLVLKGALEKSDAGLGLPALYWLRLRLTRPGCEEMPALRHILAGCAHARQVSTISEQQEFTLTNPKERVALHTHLACEGHIEAYARDARGWKRAEVRLSFEEEGALPARIVALEENIALAADGAPNLRVVACAPWAYPALKQDSSGLPAERLELLRAEGAPLAAEVSILCAAGDGYFADWRYIDALHKAGPHDRVFTIEDGALRFGDNIAGRVPPAGREAIRITSLAYTRTDEGSITPGTHLYLGTELPDAGEEPIGEALLVYPGRSAETIGEMQARLRALMAAPAKAVTAADYAALAERTPGVRIAYARAVPFLNPATKGDRETKAHVSVVVLPDNAERFPMPDAAFLAAVQRKLEQHRSVCTAVHAIGPEYIGITVWAELLSDAPEEAVRAEVEAALHRYFTSDAPGERLGLPVLENELNSAVGSCRSVLGLVRLEARSGSAKCKKTPQGELIVPLYAIAYLSALELHITHV